MNKQNAYLSVSMMILAIALGLHQFSFIKDWAFGIMMGGSIGLSILSIIEAKKSVNQKF